MEGFLASGTRSVPGVCMDAESLRLVIKIHTSNHYICSRLYFYKWKNYRILIWRCTIGEKCNSRRVQKLMVDFRGVQQGKRLTTTALMVLYKTNFHWPTKNSEQVVLIYTCPDKVNPYPFLPRFSSIIRHESFL